MTQADDIRIAREPIWILEFYDSCGERFRLEKWRGEEFLREWWATSETHSFAPERDFFVQRWKDATLIRTERWIAGELVEAFAGIRAPYEPPCSWCEESFRQSLAAATATASTGNGNNTLWNAIKSSFLSATAPSFKYTQRSPSGRGVPRARQIGSALHRFARRSNGIVQKLSMKLLTEGKPMRFFLWSLTLGVVAVPTVLLLNYPDTYNNPVVVFLLSVALCGLSVLASRHEFVASAHRAMQTEWLSQAESACDRLLTTAAHVLAVRGRMNCTCDSALHDLPELQTDELKAVRVLLSAHCREAADNMTTIANHMESAIADWQRFIAKNCEGEDCTRIGRNLDKRRAKLWSGLEGEPGKEATNEDLVADSVANPAV